MPKKKNAQKKAYQKRVKYNYSISVHYNETIILQMFDRRKKFLKSESEKKQWAEIEDRYMTQRGKCLQTQITMEIN